MRKTRKRWHHHGPPRWHREQDGEWDWEEGPRVPPWLQHRRPKHKWESSDQSLFIRFAIAFGLFALLGCGGLVALAAGMLFFLRNPPAEPQPLRWVLGIVPVVILLALALRSLGRFTARRFTAPLSGTMKAAEAMAEGDLAARAPVEGSPEFRRFARSFNQMAAALETADRHRRELLADIAHELRTPLTVVQGNLEGLRDGVYELTPEHLDLVLDETHKLGRLVEDLRLLTLAEAGQLPLDPQSLDVPQLLCDVRDAFAPQADEAGVLLVADASDWPAEGECAPALLADPQRMGQILGNLVSNALHHTPPGGEVALGVALLPEGDGIRVWVSDTGAGIPPEDLPRIFDRFWRGDPARVHEGEDGAGLGLAIAKSLVEAHGGRIWAESQEGEGTRVSLVLPLPAERESAQ